MRFLFINQYYAPDYAATAQQLSDLCECLAALGHEVHVLTSSAIYDGRPLELPAEETLNGVHVHRLGLATASRQRLRQRLVGYLSFYARAFARIHLLPKPDVVVTLTTPPMISLLGTWLRLMKRTRFVHWVMDIYPDIAIRAGVLNRLGPTRTVWSSLGRISYITANRIVVLGEDMRDTLRRKGIREHKLNVIHCWSSSTEVHPLAHADNPFRKEHFPGDPFCLMYSGNMGTCHTFETTVEAARRLAAQDSIRFAFVGGGKQLPFLRESLAGLEGTVKFLPYQDRGDLSESLSAPDAHLVTLQPRFDGLLVPSKIYGIMAAARAILFVGSTSNEIARIIRAADCGMVVAPDDPAALVDAIAWMAAHRDEVRAMGQRGCSYFQEHFEREISTRRFARLLENEGLQPGVRGVRSLCHETLVFFKSHGRPKEPEAPPLAGSEAAKG